MMPALGRLRLRRADAHAAGATDTIRRNHAQWPKGCTEGHLTAKTLTLAAALVATTVLGGCTQIKKMVGGKPAGQVVATVNGEEITALELKAEMGNFASKDPNVMKQAQQAALQQIIVRDVLAQKAKEEKLDKSPEYALQVKRGEETLLAQLLERKVAASVAVPSRQEAEAFVSAHPGMFADRKILVVEQVMAQPTRKITPEEVKNLKTLEDVKALFDAQSIPYRENVSTIDTLSADPRLVDQIGKLPPGEVFVVPQGGVLLFNRITSTKPAPIHGDQAVNFAINAVRNQKAQEAVRTQMKAFRSAAEKSIVYNAAYKPPPTPATAAAAPAAGATPAAPPAK